MSSARERRKQLQIRQRARRLAILAKKYLKYREIGRMVDRTESDIYRYVRDGYIPYYKMARKLVSVLEREFPLPRMLSFASITDYHEDPLILELASNQAIDRFGDIDMVLCTFPLSLPLATSIAVKCLCPLIYTGIQYTIKERRLRKGRKKAKVLLTDVFPFSYAHDNLIKQCKGYLIGCFFLVYFEGFITEKIPIEYGVKIRWGELERR